MRILVFAPNWLGDVIFITPIFAALKKQYPGVTVGCCLPKRCEAVLYNNPNIDEIITFNEKKEDKGLLAHAVFTFKLRCRKYDRVILLHRSMTRALLCSLAGIRERWGYGYKKRSWLLTQSLPVINKDSLHKQDYYLDLVRGLGVDVSDNNCRVFVSDEEKAWARSLLQPYRQQGKKIVALNLLTNWAPKNWPLEYFSEFIMRLMVQRPNTVFVLTSASGDNRFKVLTAGNADCVLDLTGKTSLRQLAALYSCSDLVVSGDSGPLHLAAALGRQYIGLYGPTSARLTGVRSSAKGMIVANDNGCRTPCYIEPCEKGLQCMGGILPDAVVKEAIAFL